MHTYFFYPGSATDLSSWKALIECPSQLVYVDPTPMGLISLEDDWEVGSNQRDYERRTLELHLVSQLGADPASIKFSFDDVVDGRSQRKLPEEYLKFEAKASYDKVKVECLVDKKPVTFFHYACTYEHFMRGKDEHPELEPDILYHHKSMVPLDRAALGLNEKTFLLEGFTAVWDTEDFFYKSMSFNPFISTEEGY